MRLASVRQTLETGFIILGITEPRFDTLRFKDRGYLPAAGIDDGVIALVPSVTVSTLLPKWSAIICWLMPQRSLVARNWALPNVFFSKTYPP